MEMVEEWAKNKNVSFQEVLVLNSVRKRWTGYREAGL